MIMGNNSRFCVQMQCQACKFYRAIVTALNNESKATGGF